MTSFDLDNSLERIVCDRLREYLGSNLSHDTVLELIGRDFPCLDEDLVAKCEHETYMHYHMRSATEHLLTVKGTALAHSSFQDPFNALLSTDFHLREGEDVCLAVRLENTHYGIGEQQGSYSIWLDDMKVNSLSCILRADERRRVCYVPLKVLSSGVMGDAFRKRLTVKLQDENIGGRCHTMEFDVFCGNAGAAEVFDLFCHNIYANDRKSADTTFSIWETDRLSTQVIGGYDEDRYGKMGVVELIVRISRVDGADPREVLIRKLYLFPQFDCESHIDCHKELFTCSKSDLRGDVPFFVPMIGRYRFDYTIWDEVLWSKEITFTA